MEPKHLFTTALGLTAPWEVTDVRFDPQAGRIDLEVAFAKGSRFACPACGAEGQPVHDTRSRSWQHLSFFQYRAYLHALLPRVRCESCGKTTQVQPPWARAQSGFTALMEALVVTLCQAMPVATVARHLGVGDERLWGVLEHYVDAARTQEDHSQVSAVGLDETAARRGQHYISLFHDLQGKRLLFACEGRDQSTVAAFAADLKAHGGDPQAIEQVCIDMSGAYLAGVAKHLPKATVSFDAFHVIKLANEAVDKVRREEVKTEPALRGTRWTWLKDAHDWTREQLNDFHWLSRARLKTARAWRLKEALRDIYATATTREQAEAALTRWYSWARRSRLPPMKRLATTLKEHWDGVLAAFDSGLTNGRAEGINSLVQAAKARARGYRTTRSLITIAYLIAGNLAHLPASPFNTSSGVRPQAEAAAA
jgi:transposase